MERKISSIYLQESKEFVYLQSNYLLIAIPLCSTQNQ